MSRAESEAARVLAEAAVGEALPIDVAAVARYLGAQIVEEKLDDDVSGMLYRDPEHAVIGVNAGHSEARRRFTIAHEIGHLVLHKGRPLVVDHVRVNFRDAKSSTATDFEEIQANQFAAALIMPADLVVANARPRLEKSGANHGQVLEDLAEGFAVSEQAMDYRLLNLGLRRQI